MTREEPFYLDEDEKITVSMMRMRRPIKAFYRDMKPFRAKVLRLPYAGNRVSMILILPLERHHLHNAAHKIHEFGVQKLLEGLEEEYGDSITEGTCSPRKNGKF